MATVTLAAPTPSQTLEWLRLAAIIGIIAVFLALFIWLVVRNPKLLEDKFDMLVGLFIGMVTGALLVLRIPEKKGES